MPTGQSNSHRTQDEVGGARKPGKERASKFTMCVCLLHAHSCLSHFCHQNLPTKKQRAPQFISVVYSWICLHMYTCIKIDHPRVLFLIVFSSRWTSLEKTSRQPRPSSRKSLRKSTRTLVTSRTPNRCLNICACTTLSATCAFIQAVITSPNRDHGKIIPGESESRLEYSSTQKQLSAVGSK